MVLTSKGVRDIVYSVVKLSDYGWEHVSGSSKSNVKAVPWAFYSNRTMKVTNQGILKIRWWKHYVGSHSRQRNLSHPFHWAEWSFVKLTIHSRGLYLFVMVDTALSASYRILGLTQRGTRNGSLVG